MGMALAVLLCMIIKIITGEEQLIYYNQSFKRLFIDTLVRHGIV